MSPHSMMIGLSCGSPYCRRAATLTGLDALDRDGTENEERDARARDVAAMAHGREDERGSPQPSLPPRLAVTPAPSEWKPIDGRGSGFGNCARAQTPLCVASTESIHGLVNLVQLHKHCPGDICGVDGGQHAYWGCHSLGTTNVLTFACSHCQAGFVWSSTSPLPGAPARPSPGANITGGAVCDVIGTSVRVVAARPRVVSNKVTYVP